MWDYKIRSDSFSIHITGGSVKIISKETDEIIREYKGHKYLYTGAVHPAGTEFFALENGKHFYVYSLEDFQLIKRITLPRNYESVDMLGFYSEDGSTLTVPAERYIYDDREKEQGHYEYVLCRYSTENYSLTEIVRINNEEKYRWDFDTQ